MRKVLALAAAAGATLVLSSGIALADARDYRFEAVQPHVKAAVDTVVAVRLIHLPDNKPVPGAVIFASRMDMKMNGMAPMSTKLVAAKTTTPGEYSFQGDLSSAGPWTLTVSAKIQGEPATVTGEVPFMAMN
jgi:hypothetical protein